MNSRAHGFVNFVGLIDRTLFPLAFAPTLNAEYYLPRKCDYKIKGLTICDNVAMGWAGSMHNNRVWSNSDVYWWKDKYFDHIEYLLGDSSFSASLIMVTTFKKDHNATPAPLWFIQSDSALNFCSKQLILLCTYLPDLLMVIPLYLFIWDILFAVTDFVAPFNCNCHQLSTNQSMELISGFGPSLCHSTIPLVLLAAALRALFWWLKQHFPQNNGLSYSSSLVIFLQQLGRIAFLHSLLYIFLSSLLLLDILSTIYMYGPFTICVKKRWEFERRWESKFVSKKSRYSCVSLVHMNIVKSNYGWHVVGDGVSFVLCSNIIFREPNLSSTFVIALFTYETGEIKHVYPNTPFCCPMSALK